MKKILLIMFIVTSLTALSDEYCNAVTNNQDEYISNVEFGDINNSSAWYSDVTVYNDTTDIDVDEDYILEVTIENYYDNDSLSVWIDIDHSETYDSDERLILNYNGSVFIDTINISSDSDFEYGVTRMRLRLTYGIAPEPCDSLYYGETEDYYVNIIEPSSGDVYCEAVSNTEDEYISNVEFGDINNSSAWYSDVTVYNDTTNIDVDEDYIIEVTIENYYDNDSLSVWIDIDQSETYDSDERLMLNYNGSVFIGTINISSDSDFEYGVTRMRLRLTYGIAPEPCDSLDYGETEDYYVNIVESSSSDVYCEATTTNDDMWIASVRFGDIDNSSFWDSDVTVYEQYTDFEPDKSQFIIVEVADYFDSYDSVTVWIDFDHSGTFDNDEEYNLYVWGYKNYNKFFTGNLFLSSSSDFDYGTTRMRVRLTNDVTPDPCGSFDHGETEDYFVDIVDATDSYCKPVILWDDIYISNVGFSNIDNSTDWDFKVNIYDDEVADIKLDTNYTITVTVNNYEDGDSVNVWLDIDQSETYDNDELLQLNYINGGLFQGTINISSSSDFTYGETRMRVKLARGEDPSACYNYSKGETEDYIVDIQYSAPIEISKEVQVTMYMDGQWDGSSHTPMPVSGEIRSGDDLISSTLVSRVAAIVGNNGVVTFDFEDADDGDYWLVVRAGGYLPLGSTSKVTISSETATYDFTDDDTKAAGGDRALKESNGVYLLRTGDLNFDRRVSAGDVPYISDPYGKNLRPYVPEP